MWIYLLLFALISAEPPAQCKPQFAPLETGSSTGASELKFWRKDEAGNWSGTGWLGWNRESETLQPVRLIVRAPPAELADSLQDEVSVEGVPKVTFAARCVAGLRAGKIVKADVVSHDLQYRRGAGANARSAPISVIPRGQTSGPRRCQGGSRSQRPNAGAVLG